MLKITVEIIPYYTIYKSIRMNTEGYPKPPLHFILLYIGDSAWADTDATDV